jgi:hypothetical protein
VEARRGGDGIEPLRRIYDLRHTFATFALRAGISTFDLVGCQKSRSACKSLFPAMPTRVLTPHTRIVVVVLIEHGGFGAEAAAPVAQEIYSSFFRIR